MILYLLYDKYFKYVDWLQDQCWVYNEVAVLLRLCGGSLCVICDAFFFDWSVTTTLRPHCRLSITTYNFGYVPKLTVQCNVNYRFLTLAVNFRT